MGQVRADDEAKGNEEAARQDQGGVPRDRSLDERKLHQVPRLDDQGDVQAVPSNYHLDHSREHRGLRDQRVCDANQDECDHKLLGHQPIIHSCFRYMPSLLCSVYPKNTP
mgnify:CR=1 FL=1